jgi:isopentenyl diphosphate isomerase/L-lactate dehydrogenase-like FMN-dependent dehydrogenase
MLDGGVRHGVDAVVARCLGADAAVATRPVAAALAADGERAVAALLSGWLDEITSVTSWLGVSSLDELDRSFLHDGPGA